MKKILAEKLTIPAGVEDPDIYAAEPIMWWQQSDKGKWFMENAHDPTYHIINDVNSMNYLVAVYGQLTEQDEIIYRLKWS